MRLGRRTSRRLTVPREGPPCAATAPPWEGSPPAFSLIELLCVVALLVIYANAQGGKFPDLPGAQTSEGPLDLLVPKFTVQTASFICPGTHDSALPSGESFRNRTISYAYYMGRHADDGQVLMTDRQVDTNSKTAGQPLFSISGRPPGNNHGRAGGNLLFSDGHVQSTPGPAPCSLVLTQGLVLLNPR